MNIEEMSLQELAQEQEKHRKQMEANREKVRRRKARTHKLILIGAVVARQIPSYEEMDNEKVCAEAAKLMKLLKVNDDE